MNVLTLDSVSREHFFRQLPNTAREMQAVNQIRSLDDSAAEILDFEMFQSLAPKTFPNMRALFRLQIL